MQARFPSTCPVCRRRIEAGTEMSRHFATKAFVHDGCENGTIAPWDRDAKPAVPATTPLANQPRQGTFTVVADAGRRTIRVSQVVEGKRFVSLLAGPERYECIGLITDAGFRFTRKWETHDAPLTRTAVAAVITFDPAVLEAAGRVYAMESGNCWVCGRELTTPESIEAGIGPVCATREAA